MVTKKRKRKKRSEAKPFWKKHPELKRIARHIGKMIDNEGLTDFLAGLGCFAAGSLAAYNLGSRKIEEIIGTGFSGLIAYKLARSRNLIAGASGTLYLAGLGLIDAWNPLTETVKSIPFLGEPFKEIEAAASGYEPEKVAETFTFKKVAWRFGLLQKIGILP